MTKGVKIALAAVGGLMAFSCLCCGGLALLGDDAKPGSASPGGTGGQGFSMKLPPGFTDQGNGVWEHVVREDTQTRTLKVSRLDAVPRGDPQAILERLWRDAVTSKPEYAKFGPPLPQRRFTQNGARAHFVRTRVWSNGSDAGRYISIYLIEADDQFVPLIITQDIADTSIGSVMIIQYSWGKSHAPIEELFKNINGSPTGVPLIDDEEVVGHFTMGDTSTLQWVNTMTGGTSMTAVARAIEYTFQDDGTFTYQFSGGSGVVGAMKFGTEKDQGRWKIEHDVLVIDGDLRDRKYFITGAGHAPNGTKLLLLQPEPNWSLAPQAESELYVTKE